jgi:hypothetical protein
MTDINSIYYIVSNYDNYSIYMALIQSLTEPKPFKTLVLNGRFRVAAIPAKGFKQKPLLLS